MILRKFAVKVWMSPMAVVVGTAMILGLASSASASAVTEKRQTAVTGADAKAAVDVVMAKVTAGEIAVKAAPVSALNTSKASVLAINSKDGVFTLVTLPVGGGYSLVSNFAVIFTPGGEVAQTSETLFNKNGAGNFQIAQYTDGKLTKSRDIGLAYRTDAEMLNELKGHNLSEVARPAGEVARPASVGAAAGCLAGVLGVSSAFAYLIVSSCGVACAAAESGVTIPICVACIAAYAALGTGSVSAVVECFKLLK